MLGITILIFEILMIIFFGIFIRTDSTSTASLTSLDSGLFFTAGNHSQICSICIFGHFSQNSWLDRTHQLSTHPYDNIPDSYIVLLFLGWSIC